MKRKIRQLVSASALAAASILLATPFAKAEVINLICTSPNAGPPNHYWIDLNKKTITLDMRGAAGGSVLTGPVAITATTYSWLNFSSWEARVDRTTGNLTVWDSNNQYPGYTGKCSKGSEPMPAAKL